MAKDKHFYILPHMHFINLSQETRKPTLNIYFKHELSNPKNQNKGEFYHFWRMLGLQKLFHTRPRVSWLLTVIWRTHTSMTYVFFVFNVGRWSWPVMDESPKSPLERRKRNLIFFSNFEKRKRKLTFLSLVLIWEIWKRVLNFQDKKEKGVFFFKFQEDKEKCKKSPIARKEIWNSKFGKGFYVWEKLILIFQDSEEKENLYLAFWNVFPFCKALPIILWQPKL